MSRSSIAPQLGYCGKVPTKGDFVQYQFDDSFFSIWNEWLQSVVAVSKEQLASDWLDTYLTSPIWHFALSEGLLSDTAVHGTLIPSVDQVGRHYPFSILATTNVSPVAAWQNQTWKALFETKILESLDDGFLIEPWYQDLKTKYQDISKNTLNFKQFKNTAENLESIIIQGTDAFEALDLLHQHYKYKFGMYSLWWTEGSDLVEPCLIVVPGLPQVGQFSSMLDGKWQQRQWNCIKLLNKDI